MWKLVSETPQPDGGVYQIWRDGDEVVYRLIAPPCQPGPRLTARDVLNEWEELQKADPDE